MRAGYSIRAMRWVKSEWHPHRDYTQCNESWLADSPESCGDFRDRRALKTTPTESTAITAAPERCRLAFSLAEGTFSPCGRGIVVGYDECIILDGVVIRPGSMAPARKPDLCLTRAEWIHLGWARRRPRLLAPPARTAARPPLQDTAHHPATGVRAARWSEKEKGGLQRWREHTRVRAMSGPEAARTRWRAGSRWIHRAWRVVF
jgi:hypothetical protein